MPRRILALALASLVAAGCGHLTYNGTYDAKAFAPLRIAADQKVPGRAMIRMSAKDEGYVYSGSPDGWVGSSTTLTMPLGTIAKEAAARIFGDLFLGGVQPPGEAAGGDTIVLSPRVTRFSFRLGWTTATFQLSVHVAARSADGRVVWESDLDSPDVETRAPNSGETQSQLIVGATHVAMQGLMLKAAEGIKAALTAQVRDAAL